MKKVTLKRKGLYTRGQQYYVRRAIPANLQKLAGKCEFVVSLKTSDLALALQKYDDVIKGLDYTMKCLRDGTYVQKTLNFEDCKHLAASNGRELACISEVVQNPVKVAEIAKALVAAKAKGKATNQVVQSYVKLNDKRVKISQLVNIYLEAEKLELQNLNKREYGRKIDPLKNACNQLIKFLGSDKFVDDFSKSDARAFYNELKDRVYDGKISPNTANKYLTHLRVLIDTYYHEHDITKDNVIRGLRFSDTMKQRTPLRIEFIRDRWIDQPVFEKTSRELLCLVWAMIDTGAGFKELCQLDPDKDIHLDGEIPYIQIRPTEKRQLKTKFRTRDIPLVNLALKAFEEFPRGFTTYNTVNGPTNASGALNKFMKNNCLFESSGQSINSIRHCFKDRLRAHEIPAEMQDNLMGHKSSGMGSHYGNGYTLKQKHEALLKLVDDLK